MNFKILLFLDRLIGKILLGALKIIPCGKRAQPDDFDQIVILKFFGNGSLMLAAPALYAVKRRYPNAEMILYTTKNLQNHSRILRLFDQAVVLEVGNGWRSFTELLKLRKICRSQTSLLINLELHSRVSVFLTSFLRGSYTVSPGEKISGIDCNFASENQNMPEFYDNAAKALGITVDCAGYSDFLNGSAGNEKRKKQIVIAPFCSKLSLRRMWSLEKWSELLRKLSGTFPDYQLIIIGSPGDRAAAQTLYSDTAAPIHNCCGETTMAEALELIRESACFCGIDSAPLHLARLVKTPSVSLWGATVPESLTRMTENYPEVIISACRECSPCVHHPQKCSLPGGCLNTISVETVFQAANEILHGKILQRQFLSAVSERK